MKIIEIYRHKNSEAVYIDGIKHWFDTSTDANTRLYIDFLKDLILFNSPCKIVEHIDGVGINVRYR